MIEVLEDVRSEVVAAVREATGLAEVFIEPPEIDADDTTYGDHAVVLMEDRPEAEGVVTIAHVLAFTIWLRLHGPRPDWERERLALSGCLSRELQSTRFRGMGYLPRLVDPFAEAAIGPLGPEWFELMVGWEIRVSLPARR